MLTLEGPQRVGVLIEEWKQSAAPDRRDLAEAKAQQDSTLDPPVDSPASVASPLGGTHDT
jgi:hypothetical protein